MRTADEQHGVGGQALPARVRWVRGEGLRRIAGRRVPFSYWSKCSGLIETFVESNRDHRNESPWDEGSAAVLSGLLEATGCAVISTSVDDKTSFPVVATGMWEGESLAGVLLRTGCDWTAALGEDSMHVLRRGNRLKLRSIRRLSWPPSSSVVLPLRWCGEAVGALLIVYARARSFSDAYLAAAKLLAGFVEMKLSNERLTSRVQRQGEWISRLTSDVERMSILLRSVDADSSLEAS